MRSVTCPDPVLRRRARPKLRRLLRHRDENSRGLGRALLLRTTTESPWDPWTTQRGRRATIPAVAAQVALA
jgi:hypothetical protein